MSTEISAKLFRAMEDSRGRGFKNFVGRVLTMIDAISTDSTQRKAVKDMAEEILYRHANLECENLRYHMHCLAEALGEKSPWFLRDKEVLRKNPLTD